MATWGEVEQELLRTQTPEGAVDYDGVRRQYLKDLAAHTGRNVIVYETAGFAPPTALRPSDISISLDPDVAAFMETVHGLPRDVPLDLMLHSPGGSAEAAEAIIKYLRGRFPGLRVIVPVAAMSAASMMAMAADEIVLAAHSQLGPIDPQITLQTPEGPRTAPAAAIIQQFKEAQDDLQANPQHMSAWLPILRSHAPALLQICEDSTNLSRSMVAEWLERYMFAGDAAAAKNVADVLGDYEKFKSHARGIDRVELRALGLNIVDLEDDQTLQDLVLSVHHSISHLMDKTGTVKIVENHLGKAWLRRVGTIQVPIQVQGGPQPPGSIPPGQQPNRQQRRAAEAQQRKNR